jgi:hypothetical protein
MFLSFTVRSKLINAVFQLFPHFIRNVINRTQTWIMFYIWLVRLFWTERKLDISIHCCRWQHHTSDVLAVSLLGRYSYYQLPLECECVHISIILDRIQIAVQRMWVISVITRSSWKEAVRPENVFPGTAESVKKQDNFLLCAFILLVDILASELVNYYCYYSNNNNDISVHLFINYAKVYPLTSGHEPGVRVPPRVRGNVLHISKRITGTAWTLNQLWSSHTRRFVPEMRYWHARNRLSR